MSYRYPSERGMSAGSLPSCAPVSTSLTCRCKVMSDILSSLPTQSLLPLALVCRRFHSAVYAMLRLRLLRTAALSNREIILECYHPMAKLTTPYLQCPPAGSPLHELAMASDLSALAAHYTRFRPTLKEEDRRPRMRRPRAIQTSGPLDVTEEAPTVDVTLDSCELFTQLCTVTHVVTLGPRKGLFSRHVNVGDGVVRVWRDWLASRAGKEPGKGEDEILWADGHRDIGVRFRVLENYESALQQQPLLLGRDEDPVVSYTLVYEGEQGPLHLA